MNRNPNRNQPTQNQHQPPLRYEKGLGKLDDSRVLPISFTVWRGNLPIRNADVALEVGELSADTYSQGYTNNNGNCLFRIDVPLNIHRLTIGGSISTPQGKITIQPFTWREEQLPTAERIKVTELGEIADVWGFSLQVSDQTGQIPLASEVLLSSHGQVETWLGSAPTKSTGDNLRFSVRNTGDVAYIKPCGDKANISFCLPSGLGQTTIFALKKTASAPKAVTLKVTPEPSLPGVFQLQVESSDRAELAAKIQIFSGDSTKLTVKVNGEQTGNPEEFSANFTAATDGTALVEVSVTEEATRDKDHPIYFKLEDGSAKGPFFLKKKEKAKPEVESVLVEAQSGRHKGRVPYRIQLKTAASKKVVCTVRSTSATTKLKVEIEGDPTIHDVVGQHEYELKGEDRIQTVHVTLTDDSLTSTRLFFDFKSKDGVITRGPFSLGKAL